MPIFGGTRRPPLEGFTREEEKRINALRPEMSLRSGDEGDAYLAMMRAKMAAEPADPLWPLCLGGHMMGQGGYAAARDAFSEVISRDPGEVRGYYWTGMACYRAAEYKQTHGDAATADVAPQEMTVENLYQEALRHFRRAMELTPDKGERDELASAASTVTRAVARKRGRL